MSDESKDNTYQTSEPECPRCGDKDYDWHDAVPVNDTWQYECLNCGTRLETHAHHAVTFDTRVRFPAKV